LAIGEKPHFFGEQGVGFVNAKQVLAIVKRNFWPYLTPLVVVPSIAGIFLFGTTSRFGKLFHDWLMAMAMFILFVGTGNADHHWYQLPLIPIASAFAAAAVVYVLRATSKKRVTSAQYSVAALVLLGSLGWLAYYGLRRDYVEWNPGCIQAAAKLDQIAPPNARLLITDEGDPSCMYYSRRKGWHFWTPLDDSDGIALLERYRARGAGYLILDEYHLWWLDYYKGFATHIENHYTIAARSNRYIVFNLKLLNP
jgi:hypothetical protein